MKCTNCDKKIDKESKFCEHCGQKVVSNKRDNHITTVKIVDHLEYLGYQIDEVKQDEKNDSFLATHVSRSNLVVNITEEYGVMFQSYYRFDEDKIRNKNDEIAMSMNVINKQATICSYCFDFKGASLMCSSWFPPTYTKKDFSIFLDLYEKDIMRQLRSEELSKYN